MEKLCNIVQNMIGIIKNISTEKKSSNNLIPKLKHRLGFTSILNHQLCQSLI